MRAAVLSTGRSLGGDSCRLDILQFLKVIQWHIDSLEVTAWNAAANNPLGSREWSRVYERDLERVAEEIAQFIGQHAVAVGAVVLARESRPARLGLVSYNGGLESTKERKELLRTTAPLPHKERDG